MKFKIKTVALGKYFFYNASFCANYHSISALYLFIEQCSVVHVLSLAEQIRINTPYLPIKCCQLFYTVACVLCSPSIAKTSV